MQESTTQKLKHFFGVSTWSSGHPLDLERFYQFTAEAYRNGNTGISFDEFFVVAKEMQEEVNEDIVRKYHSRYERTIDAIKVFDTGKI